MDNRQVEVHLCGLQKAGFPAKGPYQTTLLQREFPFHSGLYIHREEDLLYLSFSFVL